MVANAYNMFVVFKRKTISRRAHGRLIHRFQPKNANLPRTDVLINSPDKKVTRVLYRCSRHGRDCRKIGVLATRYHIFGL